MRVAACIVLVVALVSCGGDDHDPAAAKPRPTTTSTTAARCSPAPTLPAAADGSPAELIATSGDVQIAIVDHGASVDVVSLFAETDCTITAITLDDAPAAFPIGGTVTHGDGLACRDGRYEVLSATSDDGATYQATSKTYRLDGTALVQVDTAASTIEAKAEPDALGAYYQLDC